MAYQTEQKKALFAFLRGHQEDAFSIEQLAAAMAADPALPPVGKSTLYRLISQLVEEGSAKRFTKGPSRHFLYQLLPHCGGHLHLRRSRCGKLYHMGDGESAAIIEEILSRHHFAVDGADAVLPGCCENCRENQDTEKSLEEKDEKD